MYPIKVIDTALQFEARDTLTATALDAIAANAGLSATQIIAIRAVGMQSLGLPIQELIDFIRVGDFQTVGLPEAAAEPLTDDQRAIILGIVVQTAKTIIETRIADLQATIAPEPVE